MLVLQRQRLTQLLNGKYENMFPLTHCCKRKRMLNVVRVALAMEVNGKIVIMLHVTGRIPREG